MKRILLAALAFLFASAPAFAQTLDPNDVYRDYVTPGVPSSGPYDPPKSDIRTLWSQRTSPSAGSGVFGNGGATVRSTDAAIVVNNLITVANASGSHPISDDTIYNVSSGGYAAASMDSFYGTTGTYNYGHFVGLQIRPTLQSTGTTSVLYGVWDKPTVTNGTLSNRYGLWVGDTVKGSGGTIGTQIGLYTEPLTSAANNIAILTDGIAPSFFGGSVSIKGGTGTGNVYLSQAPGGLSGYGGLWTVPAGTQTGVNYTLLADAAGVDSLYINHPAQMRLQIGGANVLTMLSGAATLTGHLTVSSYSQTTATTVSGLAACATGTKGARSFVTDATAATFGTTATAGGANNVPVTCNGTSWIIG